ncbi:hypothetical protein ABPG75_013902 [Micractinium tetrahymenae]
MPVLQPPSPPLAVPYWARAARLLLLLLAAAPPLQAATVTLSSGTRTFDNTLDLSSSVGRTMRLVYTLKTDGTLTGALITDLTSSSQYAGLSFGSPHRSTPTVIYTTSFLDGYVLNGYQTSTCNAGRGQWKVTGAAVETAADGSGLLVGLFTGNGISSGSQSIGYAFGPYSGGVLGDHTRGGYPYGSTSTGGGYDVPLAGRVLSLPQWLAQEAAADWSLMMGFVVSCLAAPGVFLLVWPFIFDAALDLCSDSLAGMAIDKGTLLPPTDEEPALAAAAAADT